VDATAPGAGRPRDLLPLLRRPRGAGAARRGDLAPGAAECLRQPPDRMDPQLDDAQPHERPEPLVRASIPPVHRVGRSSPSVRRSHRRVRG